MHDLRIERNELPPSGLSAWELKERLWKKEAYERWRAESEIPVSTCARREELYAQWKLHNDYTVGRNMSGPEPTTDEIEADLLHQSEAWTALTRLINHAKYCPQCVVFPVKVPYVKESTTTKAAHQSV